MAHHRAPPVCRFDGDQPRLPLPSRKAREGVRFPLDDLETK
jgi:hypothetical protein